MFTARHFSALASTIPPGLTIGAYVRPTHTADFCNGYNCARYDIVRNLVDMLTQDNPNFDRAKFLAACNVDLKG